MTRLLIVEDERYVLESLVALFEAEGFEVEARATAEEALLAPPCDAVVTDLRLPGLSGTDLLVRLRERDPALPVVVLTGHGTIAHAVEAMRAGALDFLTKPVEPDVIVERVRKACERGAIERDRDRLRGEAEFVARSPASRQVLGLLSQIAAQPATVLLTGESGSGKELAATFLHDKSPRRAGPLVRVNCAAVPEALFEAEFFGHVAGAFTGAHAARRGYFEEADGGTLFLDEIGALPLAGQAKLLRAIETREIRPVGGLRSRRVDVRIVAATNEHLDERIARKSFREDLYYRLAGLPVRMPPLRERPEDLAALAARFAAPLGISPQAQQALARHAWPGNVRELRNVIARARVAASTNVIEAADLTLPVPGPLHDLDLRRRTADFERELFREALRRANGVKAEAARLLGFDPSNWAYHARRLGLR